MNAGKLVKSVTSDEEGWTVTFSDDTSIYIISREGLKSAVPRLSIDENGYWMVSYDGTSYIYLLDNSGNRVQSKGKDGADGKDGQDGKDGANGKDGQDGADGKDGQDGKDGADGKDGQDGKDGANGKDGQDGKDGADGKDGLTPETISVRVIINNLGCYAFELYSTLEPDKIFDVINTSYSANPATVISSIVRNDIDDLITISMADGSTFTFKIDPTLSTQHNCDISSVKLFLKDNREYLLRDITADISGNNVNILIPYICDISNMKLTVELYNKDAYVVENINEALDLTKRHNLTVSHPDGSTKTYTVNTRVFTGLPIMTIETENRFLPSDKNTYVTGTIDISQTNEFPTGFSASTSLKGRGNATWGYPKKPYRIKLDKKASIFDIPADKS